MLENEHDIFSSLDDKPKIDNGVWIPFLKDGQTAQDSTGKTYRLSKEVIDAGYQSYLCGFVDVNHSDKIKGKMAAVRRRGEFADFQPEGLDERALAVMNSPAYNGVSQFSHGISSVENPDKTFTVRSLVGKGVSIILFPKTPGCSLEAGCGIPIASEQKEFNFSLYRQNLKSSIKTTGGKNNTMSEYTKEQILELSSFLKAHPDMISDELRGAIGNPIQSTSPDISKIIEKALEEQTKQNKLALESALKARDAEYHAKEHAANERQKVITQLYSHISKETVDKMLASNPPTEALKSTYEMIKDSPASAAGVSRGIDIRSTNDKIAVDLQKLHIPSIEFIGGI